MNLKQTFKAAIMMLPLTACDSSNRDFHETVMRGGTSVCETRQDNTPECKKAARKIFAQQLNVRNMLRPFCDTETPERSTPECLDFQAHHYAGPLTRAMQSTEEHCPKEKGKEQDECVLSIFELHMLVGQASLALAKHHNEKPAETSPLRALCGVPANAPPDNITKAQNECMDYEWAHKVTNNIMDLSPQT